MTRSPPITAHLGVVAQQVVPVQTLAVAARNVVACNEWKIQDMIFFPDDLFYIIYSFQYALHYKSVNFATNNSEKRIYNMISSLQTAHA